MKINQSLGSLFAEQSIPVEGFSSVLPSTLGGKHTAYAYVNVPFPGQCMTDDEVLLFLLIEQLDLYHFWSLKLRDEQIAVVGIIISIMKDATSWKWGTVTSNNMGDTNSMTSMKTNQF